MNKNYIYAGLLAFLTLSSKSILIYNEEILITACFLSFIAFSYHTMSKSVTESLDERSQAIRDELQSYLIKKEEMIQELIGQYKETGKLSQLIAAIEDFSVQNINNFRNEAEAAIKSVSVREANSALNSLVNYQNSMKTDAQLAVASGFAKSFISNYRAPKKNSKKK